MSIEYVAALESPLRHHDELVTAALAEGGYELAQPVGAGDPRCVRLRATDRADATTWSEDALLMFEPRSVRLVFHVGTRQQRERLVSAIESRLGALGVQATFEEE
jgi:hypothetical protein